MSIKVQNLSKHYNNQKALNNISFEINSGEIVGFLGPNGAGKSTLMKLLTTYLTPTEGKAYINGFDIDTQIKDVQKNIGYLPEHNPLYLNQYTKEYLNFNANLYKVSKSRITEVIELTGLQNETRKRIGELSKGYRQRVGIACALLHDPKVLLLDEPTTGLDPNQLIEIRNLIKNLGKNKTVLLSTHIMQEVEAMCNRVLVIKEGKLVADKYINDIHNQQNIVVSFNIPPKIEQLNKLPNLKNIQKIDSDKFLLSFNENTDNSIALFDFSISNNLKLTLLHPQEFDIKDIFQKLTK